MCSQKFDLGVRFITLLNRFCVSVGACNSTSMPLVKGPVYDGFSKF